MRDLTQNVGSVPTIQHQTCVDEIFKCTIFAGYGGVIFFTDVPPQSTENFSAEKIGKVSINFLIFSLSLLKT